MNPQRRRELGIRQLPASLREACESLEADRNFLKPIFSDDTLDSLIEQELKEHNEVVVRPHPHEFSIRKCLELNGKVTFNLNYV